jgi:amino acid adenylation domain-containing protein
MMETPARGLREGGVPQQQGRPALHGRVLGLNLAGEFLASASCSGDRLALSVDGVDYSYSQLAGVAGGMAAWLRSRDVGTGNRVGIVASRSVQAFAGILATCWVGATYVPINVALPPDALLRVFKTIKPDALIADGRGAAALSGLDFDRSKLLAPAQDALGASRKGTGTAPSPSLVPEPLSAIDGPPCVPPEATAYVEFTSGTTGIPKGVMISVGAVTHFLQVMQKRYNLNADDRVAATSDITFDISTFNVFMAWKAGASLHVVPASQLIAPAKFIRERQITVWFSVPSTATVMHRMHMLEPGAFPSLRYTLFCGEPLPLGPAVAWQKAAANGIVENFYGPTEATVFCTVEPLGEHPNVTPGRGIVAIGRPLPGMEVAILDSELNLLPPNQPGQIALSGPQLAQGYFGDPILTQRQFPVIGGRRWYLTGDLGCQDSSGIFHFLGRIDNQVKVLGNRVELEEVETHLRDICKSEMVAALAWPIEDGSAQGLVAFVSATEHSPSQVKQAMEKRVVSYMVPKVVHVLRALPLNSNGKVDRKALLRLLMENLA